MRRWPLLLALLVLAAQARAAAPPAVGRDLHGDPLPPGAVTRLGSMRLRQLAPFNRVAVSRDGTLVASVDYNIRVWDRQTGRLLRDLAEGRGVGDTTTLADQSIMDLIAAGQAASTDD